MFPTPSKGMYKQDVNDDGDYAERVKKAGHQVMLPAAVKLYPTPTSSDHKGWSEGHKRADDPSNRLDFRVEPDEHKTRSGQLHSKWVCWLMGYPLDWLELEKESTRIPESWDQEPEGLPRVTTGEKERVSKLKGLGNAIVPEVSIIVMQKIKRMMG